jgi:putative NIF3 family GTP cyclohydrolase 1 type 2
VIGRRRSTIARGHTGKPMKLAEVVARLDTFFDVKAFAPDRPFAQAFPQFYAQTSVDASACFERSFLATGNGLILRAQDDVAVVNTTVFISDETVRKAADRSPVPQLLCAHHPLDFETAGRGFLPLSAETLRIARRAGVSLYSVHNPLDAHQSVSTGRPWAERLGLRDVSFGPADELRSGGGLTGTLAEPMSADELCDAVRRISGVEHVNAIKRRPVVRRITVLPGACEPDGLQRCQDRGCDAVVTGTYYHTTQTEPCARLRAAFEQLLPSLDMTLVECSHYASEALVMREDFRHLCRTLFGLDGDFIEQDDPWH